MRDAQMSDRLNALEDWAANLLGQLELRPRNELIRTLGREILRSQKQRIVAQQNPDSTPYAPRKKQHVRDKYGRVKRSLKMFKKLNTRRYLKVQGNERLISIGFIGRIARIAKVHQFGLRDNANKRGLKTTYKRREILGVTNTDISLVRDSILNHLSQAKSKTH
ncbi:MULTISPECIES: phage virion morphogenesis protein [unclassified Pseudomonas]|uniref:phage virion morphogenesis protein n=1 Tax=unclassified Pseudomonas TaxID=196821 RepID=UPI0039B76DD2